MRQALSFPGMQVPRRRSEQHRKYQRPSDTDAHLTAAAIARLQDELERLLKHERSKAADEVARTKEMGDLSENAAYTEAKFHLRRINDSIFSIKERLKRAIVITSGASVSARIAIGSIVVLRVNGEERTYEILGSQETNPSRGRISHFSPVGATLLGHKAGDSVLHTINGQDVVYKIVEVR